MGLRQDARRVADIFRGPRWAHSCASPEACLYLGRFHQYDLFSHHVADPPAGMGRFLVANSRKRRVIYRATERIETVAILREHAAIDRARELWEKIKNPVRDRSIPLREASVSVAYHE